MPDPKIYTVGWICAIDTEYVAAGEFLDEEDLEVPDVSERDNNVYTLGKIGKHNVVITLLPAGEYGTDSAASVARDMVHSFPNIRIGLMVGIGGGAPSLKHDIRLGDIVVSYPRNEKGGVFQYDFGKTMQNQSFQNTRFLNQPPTILRTALNDLKARYERRGHQIKEAISSILEKNPRLKQKYGRPDLSSDRLYRSDFVHRDDTANCVVVCGDDKSNLIPRHERTENEDNPAVHFGTIASANQVMKDALKRDVLANEKDVLCFEMEAAGLMNHFPCLVIRSICDYADSHKNKDWQGYAAMVAAAYAKDLLYRIPPNKVEAERKISDMLFSIESNMENMHDDVQDTKKTVQDLEFKQRRERIEGWLSPPDPSTNYNKALRQRQEGTGLWFLKSNDAFARWKTRRNSILWLYGIPGCGKTILSSTIIEDLKKDLKKTLPHLPPLYFYFDFNDTTKQTLESMVRSLISQLQSKCEGSSKVLESLYSSCEDGRQKPSSEKLCKAFLHIIEQVKEVWIVLDALDECRTRKGPLTEGLLSWIRDLLSSEQRNVHLLVTSREEQDIKSELSEFIHDDDIVPIQSDRIAKDICAYVRTRVRKDQGFKRWRDQPAVQDEIEARLMEKADGMFRWAACQLDTLENCLNYRSLQKALASLPKTLDETYGRILRSVPEEHRSYAIRILQFLVFSERPLKIKEAVDAIAVEVDEDQYFDPKYRMPDSREISYYCSSLVVVVSTKENSYNQDENTELRLAHFSVKEYLTSNRLDKDIAESFQEVTAKLSIATVCLAYLLSLERDLLIREIEKKYRGIEEVKKRFPLAKYSAMYWMINATMAQEEDGTVQDLVKEFFCSHEWSYRTCYRLYCPDQPWYIESPLDREKVAPPLYYASFGGFEIAVQCLLNRGAEVNAQGGYYGKALQAASINGHEKVVELLLSNGADINAKGGECGTALVAASYGGHEKVVELLLSNGADINAKGGYGTALMAASDGGHEKVVELLLSNGADINAKGGGYGTALVAASYRGHEKVVKLLLRSGVDFKAQVGDALAKASGNGHEKVVELLLRNGADVEAHGGRALRLASSRHHKKVVELLLRVGVNVKALEGTKLVDASSKGNEKVVEALLRDGFDVNAGRMYSKPGGDTFNELSKTALHEASMRGYVGVVELLLKNGADVNALGYTYFSDRGDLIEYWGTALDWASWKGKQRVVEILLRYGGERQGEREVHQGLGY